MSEDQNKTEQPSSYKLKEAKKRGQVSKSTELNAIFGLIVFLILAYSYWRSSMAEFQQLARHYLVLAADVNNAPEALTALVGRIVDESLAIVLPFLAVLLLVGILTNVMQTGVILSAFPLKPDFTKLNPANSFKKIFSKKTLFELFKSSLKIILFGVLVYMVKETVLNEVISVYYAAPEQMPENWAAIFFQLAIWIMAMLIPVALIDFAFNNWDFTKRMMMSTREVKDEHKKREGDPEVKSKQKQIQKELLKKAASLGNVKDADVVITNPTHIAVALRYHPDEMAAPKIMAMGQDLFAEKIKAVARLHHIPIVQNKRAARKIYQNSIIDGFIPFDCYDLVAPIFRWVMEIKGVKLNGNA